MNCAKRIGGNECRRASSRLIQIGVAITCLCVTGPRGLAASSLPHRSSQQRVTFQDAAEGLARARHVTIIAEGEPAAEAPADVPQDVHPGERAEAAVARLAARYGYTTKRIGNAFLLVKDYRDPNEMPQVTEEECRAALKAVYLDIVPFDPKLTTYNRHFSPIAAMVAGMLTPEQRIALTTDSLKVASLAPAQREVVWRLALHYFVHYQASPVEKAYAEYEAACSGNPTFRHGTLNGVDLFGYQTARTSGDFKPLDTEAKMALASGVTSETLDRSTGRYVRDEVPPDPDIPSHESNLRSITLGEAMLRIGSLGRPGMRLHADSTVAAKTVTVAGLGNAPVADDLAALSAVYGLRIRTQGQDVILALRVPRIARTPAEIPSAVWNAVPAPLQRAISARPGIRRTDRLPQSERDRRLAGDDAIAAGRLYESACALLRSHVEPMIRSSRDGRVVLSKLSASDRMLFALALTTRFSGAVGGAIELARSPLPPWIASFDHLVLSGRFNAGKDGAPRMAFYLTLPDQQTGRLRMYAGFSNGLLPVPGSK